MPKYIIERGVPGVGASSSDQLKGMAQKSNEVLNELNGQVQWLESYVTDDKIYCVYVAPNEDLVKRHAEMAGFPADKIAKVDAILDPSSGEVPVKASSKETSAQKSLRH